MRVVGKKPSRFSCKPWALLCALIAMATAACSDPQLLNRSKYGGTVSTPPNPSVTQILFDTSPSATAIAGSALVVQPSVSLRDGTSAVVTDAVDSVTISGYSDASCSTVVVSGVQTAGSFVTAAAGIAGFSSLTLLKNSVTHLRASNGAVNSL
jgi:hypothetical protein